MRSVSDQDSKPRKIRRRRATGRVSGTTQSAFATNSMSSILQKQAEDQARKKAKSEDETSDEESAEESEKESGKPGQVDD